MGREIRRVHKDWEHPLKSDPKSEWDKHIPLFGGSYSKYLKSYLEEKQKWEEGFHEDFICGGWIKKKEEYKDMPFSEWYGEMRTPEEYMPDWSDEEKTHIQLYQNTSEGTPLSPKFEDSEEGFDMLCEWAAENSFGFGGSKKDKEEWKRMLNHECWK